MRLNQKTALRARDWPANRTARLANLWCFCRTFTDYEGCGPCPSGSPVVARPVLCEVHGSDQNGDHASHGKDVPRYLRFLVFACSSCRENYQPGQKEEPPSLEQQHRKRGFHHSQSLAVRRAKC
jgi:hypothetical protein